MAYTAHTVKQGDTISSIAYQHGLFPDTIWDDPENADLKSARKDPNVLFEGDVVRVREKEEKQVSCASDKRHRFRRKGVPAKFKVKLLLNNEPRANEPYRLVIDGVTSQGTSGGDGLVESSLPPDAREGTLYVGETGQEDVYQLKFGTLDPIDTDEGVKQRLLNLGYGADRDLEQALRDFQAAEDISVTGSIDQQTRDQLKQRAGE